MCQKKKKVVCPEEEKGQVIKEVFILFLIFDYLPFQDLIRLSQISRGIYWLSGS